MIRLLFSLATKTFLMQNQMINRHLLQYKLNFRFSVRHIISKINMIQIQLFYVINTTILFFAYHLTKRI
ncbi:unnamed protein product [Paramecium octaurelia]|uniref:Uncharacterized protein n=1 Tax=Paramecium octaurelia TaxID=43137 RepID=A0A8S1VK32_PAROT|nr:unnamed protein product [Paramecium octaurelia]